jgi:putative endonuclease
MLKSSKWEVYIIEAESGKLYTGITNDLDKRFADHLNGRKGARFFHFSAPKKVLFREACANRSEATQREIQIKKLNRMQKLDLISAT